MIFIFLLTAKTVGNNSKSTDAAMNFNHEVNQGKAYKNMSKFRLTIFFAQNTSHNSVSRASSVYTIGSNIKRKEPAT